MNFVKNTNFDKKFSIKIFFEKLLIKKVKLFQFRYIDLNSEDTRMKNGDPSQLKYSCN